MNGNDCLQLGSLSFTSNLIQGPLAGYSCQPFRELFNQFKPPAYCVSEMISAHDVIAKHQLGSRYLYRSTAEQILCYQISGTEPDVMAKAAIRLQEIGADIIDINCGCPKRKIRKKGAGSALLENHQVLLAIVSKVRDAISIPLTVKIRILDPDSDIALAQKLERIGIDALIVHGRRWDSDYDVACNLAAIKNIKQQVAIPVIANGDIKGRDSLANAITKSMCDAFMISRAGCGSPWLYQELLEDNFDAGAISTEEKLYCFMTHLQGLCTLEDEHKAVLQSKNLVRYYFRHYLTQDFLTKFYQQSSLLLVDKTLREHL